MSARDNTYKHFVPGIDLAIERYTINVPNDGKYYITKGGKAVQGFRSMKQAEERFTQLLDESGFKRKPMELKKANPVEESVERILSAKKIFWAEGPKRRNKYGKGGKGGRGGV